MPSFGGAASSCFSRTLSSNEWGARVLTLPQVGPTFDEGGIIDAVPLGTQVPVEGELFGIETDKIMVPYENLTDILGESLSDLPVHQIGAGGDALPV